MDKFVVGIGSDFYDTDGLFKLPSLRAAFLDLPDCVELVTVPIVTRSGVCPADSIRGMDAIVMSGGSIDGSSIDGNDQLAVVCRWGVGYDSVNLADCAERGVLVTNAPEGVKKSMAHSAMAFVLVLAHRIFDQDRAIRNGNVWSTKHQFVGTGLVDKTLGVIGLGNIGSEILRVASVFGCEVIGHDPYADLSVGPVTRVELDDLMARSDYIIIQCALTPETRGMISRERLAMMKPTAYLVNTARGPIVDEQALCEALTQRKIAGAALDVFANEPIEDDNPLLKMDNVILTPHSIGWTDDFARTTARSVSTSIRSVLQGEIPLNTVNRRELEAAAVQPRYTRYRNQPDS
jgi:phosphoglycerate dehydrogenase-like enzyme